LFPPPLFFSLFFFLYYYYYSYYYYYFSSLGSGRENGFHASGRWRETRRRRRRRRRPISIRAALGDSFRAHRAGRGPAMKFNSICLAGRRELVNPSQQHATMRIMRRALLDERMHERSSPRRSGSPGEIPRRLGIFPRRLVRGGRMLSMDRSIRATISLSAGRSEGIPLPFSRTLAEGKLTQHGASRQRRAERYAAADQPDRG